MSGGNRFSRLYAQAEATRSKLAAARESVDPECTFKPQLAAKSPAASMRDQGQVFDTLYAKVNQTPSTFLAILMKLWA